MILVGNMAPRVKELAAKHVYTHTQEFSKTSLPGTYPADFQAIAGHPSHSTSKEASSDPPSRRSPPGAR